MRSRDVTEAIQAMHDITEVEVRFEVAGGDPFVVTFECPRAAAWTRARREVEVAVQRGLWLEGSEPGEWQVIPPSRIESVRVEIRDMP